MKMCLRTTLIAFLALFLSPAFAQAPADPTPPPADSRIRVVPFDPDRVIALRGHLGYQMMIEFAPDEQIENVSIGDSLGWQVTPNRRATLLFLKPVQRNATTNMTVVTNRRRYAFALSADEARGPNDPALIYTLRFDYPPEPVIEAPVEQTTAPPVEQAPIELNFQYSFSGSQRAAPARVFDDGVFTYFQFDAQSDAPAIFVVGTDGQEELANAQSRAGSMVIDRVARTFVLRYGRERAVVHNDAFQEALPAADGPRPRDGRNRRQREN
ncbi:MAG: TrbG/VirB9 family P-type conjugative transfer protein [Caulobacterales bacterium]